MLDLCIFGHRSFHFTDDYVFLHPEQMEANLDPLQDKQYNGSMITKLLYKALKNDHGNYKEWLYDKHLYLTCQWFLCNPQSHLSDSFEVVQSDFLKIVMDFYETMMKADGTRSGVEYAFDIHCFLMNKHTFLFKQFIFFQINLGGKHWIMQCLCNPWMFVLKDWKVCGVYTLPSKLKNVSDDSIIHGWMMFDPMKDF